MPLYSTSTYNRALLMRVRGNPPRQEVLTSKCLSRCSHLPSQDAFLCACVH